MLIVKLEVWPKGDEKKAKELGRVTIINVLGGEEATFSDYYAERYVKGRVIDDVIVREHRKSLGA